MTSEETNFSSEIQNLQKNTRENLIETRLRANTTEFTLQENTALVKVSVEPETERYQVLKMLGEGGMGTVQLVQDSILKREVALKTIKADYLQKMNLPIKQQLMVWRLKQEAEITAVLEHPNIVPLYDLQKKNNGEVYFTMRKVQGETFREFLNKKKDGSHFLETDDLLNIFIKVCDAIAYAHSQGIIHRDLKPENVMVGQFGEVYVMDWGIAKNLKAGNVNSEKNKMLRDVASSTNFQTIGGIGTPGYMPPEQASNASQVTPASDIFALGKMLRECYSLQSPLYEFKELIQFYSEQGKTAGDQKKKEMESKIPEDIQAIIEKATQKDWKQRYASVKEFCADIERYRKNLRVSARKYNLSQMLWKWLNRNQKKVLLGAVFFLIFLGFGFYLKYQEKKVFQLNLKQAREEQIWGEQKELQEEKIDHWLKGLYAVDTALLMSPKHNEVAKIKFELSQSLIKSACTTHDFQFASYFVRGVERLEIVDPQEKLRLTQEVESAKTQSLREHQKRLLYWKRALKDPEPGMREEAILEISKMEEPEILGELGRELQEGTHYFLTCPERTSKQSEYYEMMSVALGSIGNPKAGAILWESLELMSKHVLRFKEGNRPDADVQYMVSLVQAMSNAKAVGFSENLRTLREKMGKLSLFSKRTDMSFRKLVLLENLLAKHQIHSFQNFFDRACLKSEIKDFDGAILDLNEALRLHPQFFQIYTTRGNAKQSKGDFEGAILDYTEAIRLHPQKSEDYYNRGNAKYAKKDLDSALLDYTEAIRLNPQNAEAYTNRGVLKQSKRDLEGAILDYTEAIRLNPQNAEVYNNRGLLKTAKGDVDGAILDFNEAIYLNPQDAEVYNNRGAAKEAKGELDSAILDFNEAIRINPKEVQSYTNRGVVKNMKGDLDGAILDWNEALRINPQFANVYYNRGVAKQARSDIHGAILDYTEAIRLNPQDTEAYHHRGSAKVKRGDRKGAIEDFEKGLQLQTNPQFTKTLMDLLKQQSREEWAQKDWAGAKTSLLKLKQYLPVDDPQQKQLDQKLQQLETLLQPKDPK